MKTVHDLQKSQMAGHTKLTAVVIAHRGRRVQFFAYLVHDERGRAILPQATLDNFLSQAGVRRSDTYTVS